MQSRMAILIAYCIGMKKDYQTLLNFAIFAGKWQKRTFSYKVGCKKLSTFNSLFRMYVCEYA